MCHEIWHDFGMENGTSCHPSRNFLVGTFLKSMCTAGFTSNLRPSSLKIDNSFETYSELRIHVSSNIYVIVWKRFNILGTMKHFVSTRSWVGLHFPWVGPTEKSTIAELPVCWPCIQLKVLQQSKIATKRLQELELATKFCCKESELWSQKWDKNPSESCRQWTNLS